MYCILIMFYSVALQGSAAQSLLFSGFMKVIVLHVEAYWWRLLEPRQCNFDGRRMLTWNNGVMMITEKRPSNLRISCSVPASPSAQIPHGMLRDTTVSLCSKKTVTSRLSGTVRN